jgi:pseudo-rSAM protein
MISDKKFWITIEPYVYATFTNDSALLYNTLDSNTIITNKDAILRLLSKIYSDENCGVAVISEKLMSRCEINAFIQELREKYMGDIIDISLSSGKPIQILPKLNLQNIEKDDSGEARYYNIQPSNLMDLNICIKMNRGEMPLFIFKRILTQAYDYPLSVIQLSGTNLWNHSSFKDIIELIKKLPHIVAFYSNYEEIKEERYLLSLFNSKKNILKVAINFPLNNSKFNSLIKFLGNKTDAFEFIFQVKGIEDSIRAEKIIASKKIKNYTLAPLYTKDNLDFFQKNIYLDKENILSAVVSMREIFMHQTINTNDFGKINIMPNGDVYANKHFPKLGNIMDNSLYDIIYNEMSEGKSWLRIRNQAPCTDCIYQWLCPSPSDYELAIGRPNLCHVKP